MFTTPPQTEGEKETAGGAEAGEEADHRPV